MCIVRKAILDMYDLFLKFRRQTLALGEHHTESSLALPATLSRQLQTNPEATSCFFFPLGSAPPHM